MYTVHLEQLPGESRRAMMDRAERMVGQDMAAIPEADMEAGRCVGAGVVKYTTIFNHAPVTRDAIACRFELEGVNP